MINKISNSINFKGLKITDRAKQELKNLDESTAPLLSNNLDILDKTAHRDEVILDAQKDKDYPDETNFSLKFANQNCDICEYTISSIPDEKENYYQVSDMFDDFKAHLEIAKTKLGINEILNRYKTK